MNGVHDMGGQHGMGAVHYERDEPVFHEAWEGRVWALSRALERGASGTSTPAGTGSKCCRRSITSA